MPNLDSYLAFGKLRNAVQHFAPPEAIDLSQTTLEFIFQVIDPFVNLCWGLYAIDFNEDHEPYEYFVPGIISREILFLVSPESMKSREYMNISWPANPAYVAEIKKRIDDALRAGA